uniref:Reverse transcriptase domain-containing protein n=1 Tax=Fagus sylvatica TaxID=28930 RepID=A0A2N9F131_FAGSY
MFLLASRRLWASSNRSLFQWDLSLLPVCLIVGRLRDHHLARLNEDDLANWSAAAFYSRGIRAYDPFDNVALESLDDPPLKRRKDIEDRKQEPAKQKVPKFSETPERKRTTTPTVRSVQTSIVDQKTYIAGSTEIMDTSQKTAWHKKSKWKHSSDKVSYKNMLAVRQALVQRNLQHKKCKPKTIGLDSLEKSEPSLEDQRPEEPHKPQGRHMHNRYTISWSPKGLLRTSASMIKFTAKQVMIDNVGTYPKTVSKTVDFLVVNCPSAYNAIIGRPTLNWLRAVTSIYHLLIKFPTEHGIGGVRGNQIAARECYLASLGSKGQNQTMTIKEWKTLVKPFEELDTIGLEDRHPEKTTRIGASLPPQIKESLIQFLKSNKDVFVWSHEDMPGINPSIISHKLNVNPSLRPVKQKWRVFAPERNDAIMEEVDKLLMTNFIREVFYPDWLANVVMVKKNTGKWRMCVDFIDLNKACPKDSFPLPRIDQLVDSTTGHKLLTFILKNAGATYQRLMNKMFHDQIGRNVEVYVDDMLFKSTEEDNHLDDLGETFKTLQRHRGQPR